MKIISTCRHCGGNKLAWNCAQQNKSGVVNGRLRLHDVSTIFYLGCERCSETLQVVGGDRIAEYLNENKPKSTPVPVTELQTGKLYLVVKTARSLGEIEGEMVDFYETRQLVEVLPKPDHVMVDDGKTKVKKPTPDHLKQPEWYAVRNVITKDAHWLNITDLHITEFTEGSL